MNWKHRDTPFSPYPDAISLSVCEWGRQVYCGGEDSAVGEVADKKSRRKRTNRNISTK